MEMKEERWYKLFDSFVDCFLVVCNFKWKVIGSYRNS